MPKSNGEDSPGGGGAPRAPTSFPAAYGDIVISDGFRYNPSRLTVRAGERIRVMNRASSAHSVTADDGSFDTGLIAEGDSASFRVTRPGTYHFHDRYYPKVMKGTLVVT